MFKLVMTEIEHLKMKPLRYDSISCSGIQGGALQTMLLATSTIETAEITLCMLTLKFYDRLVGQTSWGEKKTQVIRVRQKVKYSLRPITGGGPEEVQVCERSETVSGKMEQSTAEPRSVWGSPARRPALGGSHWKPICGWKCSSPGVHSHRETRPVIKGARGQDGPLIWGCREKGDQHWCICSQTMAITFLFIWRRGGFERAIWGAEEMARHRISGTTGR